MLCFFTNRPCECYHAGGMYSLRRNNVLSQMFCVHVLFPPASVAVLFLLLLSSGYFRHPLSCLWALLVHVALGRPGNMAEQAIKGSCLRCFAGWPRALSFLRSKPSVCRLQHESRCSGLSVFYFSGFVHLRLTLRHTSWA